MCLAEGSLEYTISTCKMCAILREMYRKPHAVCPHKLKMQVCRKRENHPRGADIVHHTNAEIRTFNGCGYCKWADSHPELSKRELWDNQGWPGCCRPPAQSEYQLFIKPEDWAAVSHLFKLSRSSSDAAKFNGARDDATLAKLRSSPRAKATTPNGTTNDSNTSVRPIQVRGTSDPVVGSESPLRRTITPPPNLALPTQGTPRSIKSNTSKSSQSASDDSPDTPPAHSFKELHNSQKKPDSGRSATTRDVTVVRYSPTETEGLTPRRQTVAIQSQSAFYRSNGNNDIASVISGPTLSKVRQNPSPPNGPTSLRSSPRPHASTTTPRNPSANSNSYQPTSPRELGPQSQIIQSPPTIEVLPISTRDLPEERTPRFPADAPSIGAKIIPNGFVIAPQDFNPNRSWSTTPPSSSSSSSSSHSSHSSDDGFASETSTSSHGSARSEISDASTTRGGGSSSSDFTDFLSDDSEFEIQRQAEERVVHLQRLRVERAEDREFRDAQHSLELLELTESMDLRPAAVTDVGINGTIGRRGTLLVNPRQQEHTPQGVAVVRYR